MKKMFVIQEATRTKPTHVIEVGVTVDGDTTFIHPKGKAQRAEIVPTTNVFKTEAQARKALTKGGKLMWVMDLDGWKGQFRLLQAYVQSYKKYWGTGFGRTFVDETGHRLDFHRSFAYEKRSDCLRRLAQEMGKFESELLKKEADANKHRQAFEEAKKALRKARIGWTKLKG